MPSNSADWGPDEFREEFEALQGYILSRPRLARYRVQTVALMIRTSALQLSRDKDKRSEEHRQVFLQACSLEWDDALADHALSEATEVPDA